MPMANMIKFPKASDLFRFNRKWDLHSHTTFVDGKNSVKEMIEAAENKGLELFAITEHVRSSAIQWWRGYVKEIHEQCRGRKIQVLIGMETNAIGVSGSVDVTEEMWQDAELILGSVHGYYHEEEGWAKIPIGSLSHEKALRYEVEKAIGLCHHPQIHVLAHPCWLFEKYYGEMPESELRMLFRVARETNTAIELNGDYLNNPKRFLNILMDENPTVSFGSNAHSIHEIKNILLDLKEFLS